MIRVLRAVIITPLVVLAVVIVGAVLISSGALPESLRPFLRVPGQVLPLLAVLALSAGVVIVRRRGAWGPGMTFHFVVGGLVQLAPLLLLLHYRPAVLAVPLLPGLIVLAYAAAERRDRADAAE
ncbi:hypothetical protein [Streptomyces sp. NPDC005017]|uniref:hypothetical protein n=1 Tax=Streptomyces sp. NPDC005017 TaxID=3364706 RepID=UPI0036873961